MGGGGLVKVLLRKDTMKFGNQLLKAILACRSGLCFRKVCFFLEFIPHTDFNDFVLSQSIYFQKYAAGRCESAVDVVLRFWERTLDVQQAKDRVDLDDKSHRCEQRYLITSEVEPKVNEGLTKVSRRKQVKKKKRVLFCR